MKDLINLKDLSAKEINELFKLAFTIKKNKKKYNQILTGKTLGLLFAKPSTRTRVSFEVAMHQLGGDTIFLRSKELQLNRGETIADTAKVLSRYLDGLVIRTFSQEEVEVLAKESSIPVINGLTDKFHPCQVLTDYFTLVEKGIDLKKMKFAYVGDGNNVCHSLMQAAVKLGVEFWAAVPEGYEPDKDILCEVSSEADKNGSKIHLTNSPQEAAENADCIYTDVWVSMGQDDSKDKKISKFKDFQINNALVKLAKKNYVIMHCLPAHREEEITSEVLDSKNSIVWDQAENRLHLQKAILVTLMGDKLELNGSD
ncbi:MAG: ornithine carbamoyltransferase [bacterium]|nr:ornithine carbamoyltransferase [bacterium]